MKIEIIIDKDAIVDLLHLCLSLSSRVHWRRTYHSFSISKRGKTIRSYKCPWLLQAFERECDKSSKREKIVNWIT